MNSTTKMPRNLILFALLFAWGCEAPPEAPRVTGYEAFGLIGLDREQCRRRWGIPVETEVIEPTDETDEGGEIRTYDSKGFHVQITFAGEECVAVTFKQLDGEELAPEVIDAVLGLNGDGWQPRPGEPNRWALPDGSLAKYAESTLSIHDSKVAHERVPSETANEGS